MQATRLLERQPEAWVVMLTSFADERMLLAAVDAGAVGYLAKDADPQEVIGGIRAAAKGWSPISGKVARALLTAPLLPAELLTDREHRRHRPDPSRPVGPPPRPGRGRRLTGR